MKESEMKFEQYWEENASKETWSNKAVAFDIWESKQQEIDQLKAKNAKLVHAVIDANEQKSHWAKQYWQGVERSAEYQAMLMNHPDQMAVECFKREKRIEQLKSKLAQEVEGLERFIEEDCVHDFDVLKGAVLHACNRLKAI